uniref:Kinesin-like protein n=1 Tax=Pristionchus pacificus TaxID=54126 RepID=A0A8R1YT96_PRIPA
MGGDNVVVAVRVRPFNDREKAKKCQLVVEMPDGKRTGIRDPNKKDDDPKWFTFDYSYWSHDGFKEESNGYSAPADSKYADQRKVFNDLGKGVLDNAWAGYNCSLFAYGQTGSGKSYSMVGTKTNKGIIPIVCEELFNRIGEKKGDDVDCEVFISMFEIYCEKVRDLLTTKQPPKGGLKIREHPKTGFYVEGLSSAPVSSYKEIEGKINEGTKNRTVAATAMNATSSRAHTIVKIKFNQKTKKGGGGTTTKTSEINLVDLAGSERQDKADTEGDRLKEGIVINQSLTTLGRVIKALADQQSSKGKKGGNQVPYRDSALTCLLKNALGGNSKTIMIAALSPADDNYEETLSTLRFADRAKSIKTKAVVNESATERMIRELKEENLRLQQQIGGGGHSSGSEELEALKRQLAENQKEMENLQKTWEQKLAEEAGKHSAIEGHDAALAKKRQCVPHLWNLNEDPALTDVVVHFIPEGEVTVGNKSASPPASIVLNGMAIQPQHAVLHNSGNKKISIEALSGASILINGKEIKGTTELQQNDRILFGGNHLYVFANPTKKGIDKEITYEKAQQEMTQNSGLGVARGGGAKSKEQMILEDELVALMPLVHRANAMAKELGRAVTFEIVLVSPEARGLDKGLTEVWIKVLNQTDDTHFLWEKNRFMSRYYGMQEMYENKMDGDADWNLPKERDPFYEPPDSEVFIGSAVVFLQSLSFLIDSEEAFPIVDFSGNEMGQLNVSLSPCSVAGKEIRGAFVEQPKELVGKNFAFKVKILSAIGLPKRINKTRCKYRFFGEKEVTTKTISGSNPVYSHENTYTYRPVTDKLVDHLHNSNMYVTVWGSQKGRSDRSSRTSTPASTKSTTTNGSHKAHMRLQRLLDAARSAENTVVSIKAIEEVMQGDDDDKGKKGSGRRRSSSKKKKSTESKEIKVDKPKKTTTSKSRERKKKASEAKD